MAKTYLEKMGLEPVRKLNKKICMKRVKYLQKQIDKGAFKGRLLAQARYYKSWYGSLAKRGGSRAV